MRKYAFFALIILLCSFQEKQNPPNILLRSGEDNRFIRASWNHPLREGKGTNYEGGLRIPAIVRWPRHIEGNRTSDEIIISADLYPHYHLGMPGGVIREGDYKLIEYFETGRLELYNLKEDPGEAHDLSAKNPSKADELHQKLQNWRLDIKAQMPSPNPDYIPESPE